MTMKYINIQLNKHILSVII